MLPSHEELLRAHEAGASFGELAAQYGVTTGTIKGRVRTAQVKSRLGLKTPDKPELFEVDFGQPWKLTGDFMITGDVHVPGVDRDFSMLMLAVAKKQLRKPRRLLVAGDLFNMDEFSKYDKLARLPTWHQEKNGAKQLFSEWLEVFQEIWFVMGNHDRRIQKWTANAMDGDDLIDMVIPDYAAERVRVSNYGWAVVESGGIPWRVTHPKNYSINQLTTADALAQKYQMNIISHHEHHVSMGWDRYKRFIIVNNGGLHDNRKMSYVHLDDSKAAGMANSFVMLRGGFAHLFGTQEFTDYGCWL